MRIRLFLIAFFLLASFGCKEKVSLPNEVARVNGDPIFFADLEARRVTFTASAAVAPEPEDLPQVQWQYRRVLQQLIGEQLVTQHMKKKKIRLPEGAVEHYEAMVRKDYTTMDFETALLEQGITLDAWRRNVHSMLLVEQFFHEVLRPSITITPEEVESYYAAHKNDFSFAEQWHFLQISSPDKTVVDAAKTALLAAKNATAVQQRFSVSIRDIRMAKDRLPAEVGAALTPLLPWQASPARMREGDFTSFVLVEKNPSVVLDLMTTYDRVEQVLEEEKLQKTFADWVNTRLQKSDIFIHPVLLEPAAPRPGGNNGTRAPDAANPAQSNGPGTSVGKSANTTRPALPSFPPIA